VRIGCCERLFEHVTRTVAVLEALSRWLSVRFEMVTAVSA
jgi:hypothetical protein